MPRIEVRVDEWQLAAIEQRAERDGVSLEDAMHALVTKALASEGRAAKYRALRERRVRVRAR